MNEEKIILTPINIITDGNSIEFRTQEENELIYQTQINAFIENSGVTIQNVTFPVPGYYINLNQSFGETLRCGNIINSFFALLKSKLDNTLIIVDFNGVKEVSEQFCTEYYKNLISSKNKIITINQDINVSNIFGRVVIENTEFQRVE